MAGFGGDAGLSLLIGLTEGRTARRAEERETARNDALNRLADSQVDSALSLIEDRKARRASEAARLASQQAAQAEEAERARSREALLAQALMERNADLDEATAMAAAARMSAGGVTELALPSADRKAEADAVKPSRPIDARYERETELFEEKRELLNSNYGRRLLAGIRDADEVEVNIATTRLRDVGYNEDVIQEVVREALEGQEVQGEILPSPDQARQLRREGRERAAEAVARTGGVVEAIGMVTQALSANEMDPAQEIRYTALLEELRKMQSQAGSRSSSSSILRDGGN